MHALIARISNAFAGRRPPADGIVTRCAFDRANGGSMGGPCWECEEMQSFFAGRPWQGLGGTELRRWGDNDALFTVSAYCYVLPAYLVAAIREPVELDVCVDHLAYRFGPEPGVTWRDERLTQTLGELTPEERAATRAYFEFALTQERDDFGGYSERALRNLLPPVADGPSV
jgi:hypothetical protein